MCSLYVRDHSIPSFRSVEYIEGKMRNWLTLGGVAYLPLRGSFRKCRQRFKINYREICAPVIAVIIASALDNASHRGRRTFDASYSDVLSSLFFNFFLSRSSRASVHISSPRYINHDGCVVTTIAMKDEECICIGRNFPRVSQTLFRSSLSSNHYEATRFLVTWY